MRGDLGQTLERALIIADGGGQQICGLQQLFKQFDFLKNRHLVVGTVLLTDPVTTGPNTTPGPGIETILSKTELTASAVPPRASPITWQLIKPKCWITTNETNKIILNFLNIISNPFSLGFINKYFVSHPL